METAIFILLSLVFLIVLEYLTSGEEDKKSKDKDDHTWV